jgi:Ca2+:H+ antiporter
MIVVNGVIIYVFMGGFKHHEMSFRNEELISACSTDSVSTFILVMPMVTVSTPGPDFTKASYFAGIALCLIWRLYLSRQSVIAITIFPNQNKKTDSDIHADEPSNLKTTVSVFLLLLSLVVVVGLAEALNLLSKLVKAAGAPKQL